MESMVAANMCSRPTRTFISVLAVAIGVVLMLIIGGMMSGTLNDYLNRTMSVGADFILQPSDASIFYAMTGATLPVKLAPRIKEVPGVGLVTPVLAMFDTRNFNLVFGIDPPTYNQFPGHLQMIAGRNSLENDEIIVDELYARPRHLQPGSEFMFKQHKFTVSGICRAGAAVRVFASLKTLQELNGTPDVVTFMFIKASPGTDVNRVETALRDTLSPYGYGLDEHKGRIIAARRYQDARNEGTPGWRDHCLHASELHGRAGGDVHNDFRADERNWDSQVSRGLAKFYRWHDSEGNCYNI